MVLDRNGPEMIILAFTYSEIVECKCNESITVLLQINLSMFTLNQLHNCSTSQLTGRLFIPNESKLSEPGLFRSTRDN